MEEKKGGGKIERVVMKVNIVHETKITGVISRIDLDGVGMSNKGK